MRLKTTINNELRRAGRYIHGWHKNQDDKRYYQGIVDALTWVQGSRDGTDTLTGEDVRFEKNDTIFQDKEYSIHIHRNCLTLDERGIKEAIKNCDYDKFIELVSSKNNVVYYGVVWFSTGYSVKIDITKENFKNVIHCVFLEND